MKKKRKYFPAEIRYRKEHPIVCCHMKKEEKERLIQLAHGQGKTLAQFVRDTLLRELQKIEEDKIQESSLFIKLIKKLIGVIRGEYRSIPS